MNKITIFIADSNGGYPVPASKGGAVPTLVEHLVALNNEKKLVDMQVVSIYDQKATEQSMQYPNIKWRWIKRPYWIKVLDKTLFLLVDSLTNKKSTSFLSFFSLIYYTYKASKILRKEKPKTVVLEHNIPMAWMIKWGKYRGRYFYHLHNIPRVNAWCKDVFCNCEHFLCISQFMANEIKTSHNAIGPVAEHKISLLYNCINTSLFRPIPKRERLFSKSDFGIKENEPIVLFVGRLTWEKGIDLLLKSLRFLHESNVHILIVGAKMMSLEIKDKYAMELDILAEKYKNRVHFTGYIEHARLPEIYSLSDIAVLPSMWDEPAGLTMLEAMACGIPVITTRSGGIPEYVDDAAIVLDRTTDLPEKIAHNVDIILRNKKYSESLSKKGIERVRKCFSLDNYLERFVEILFQNNN